MVRKARSASVRLLYPSATGSADMVGSEVTSRYLSSRRASAATLAQSIDTRPVEGCCLT
jgi:hypothetical protein